ncbi:MAG: hypothetical protein E7284_10180 [Lachnospiraceae bacterium]|nr:hypothetical protein [Lachnospiraceae bacterium]
MQTTKNYGLKKPEATDFYDVNDFNDNMDKIDEALKNAGSSIEVDATLSVEGKAADAKAVGTAIGKIGMQYLSDRDIIQLLDENKKWQDYAIGGIKKYYYYSKTEPFDVAWNNDAYPYDISNSTPNQSTWNYYTKDALDVTGSKKLVLKNIHLALQSYYNSNTTLTLKIGTAPNGNDLLSKEVAAVGSTMTGWHTAEWNGTVEIDVTDIKGEAYITIAQYAITRSSGNNAASMFSIDDIYVVGGV